MHLVIERLYNFVLQMEQIITLEPYLPQHSDIISLSSGIRPCRNTGIRLQKQPVPNNKTLYHNYGHGGGGISVAYGCCLNVVDTLFLESLKESKPKTVAVLGAGIMGLTTAHLLIERGFNVDLYADLIPFQRHQYKPEITTTVAAGFWMPIKVDNPGLVKFAFDTWKYYKEIYELQKKTQRDLGISFLPTYSINDTKHLTYIHIPGIIEPKKCKVRFGQQGKVYEALTFPSYIIETQKYIPYLLQIMNNTGKLKIIRKNLNQYEDILNLQETHIFNCLGLGSALILPDEHNMMPVKGHIVKMKLNPKAKDYTLLVLQNQNWIVSIPHIQSGTLCVGTTFEEDKVNPYPEPEEGQKVYRALREFFEEATQIHPKPKL